jgi:hypothetical protein
MKIVDDLPPELINYLSTDQGGIQFLEVCYSMLNGGKIPESFLKAVVSILYKKGPADLRTNYRTLSLNSSPYKIVARMVIYRLSTYCEANGILPET